MIRTRIAQALLIGPLGLLVIGACIGFTVLDPSQDLSAADWMVAVWALVSGIVNVAVGVSIGLSDGSALRALRLASVNYIAFSIVKLVAYGESAGLVFGALDVLALGLASGFMPGRDARRGGPAARQALATNPR